MGMARRGGLHGLEGGARVKEGAGVCAAQGAHTCISHTAAMGMGAQRGGTCGCMGAPWTTGPSRQVHAEAVRPCYGGWGWDSSGGVLLLLRAHPVRPRMALKALGFWFDLQT